MTAPQTNIPTETSKRLLLAIVVTREEIHVLSCVKTVVRPSRFAVTSATLVIGKQFTPFHRLNRAAMSIGASKKRTSATANDKTIAQEKTKIIEYSKVPTEGIGTPRISQIKSTIFFLRIKFFLNFPNIRKLTA
jgi:hypothetical protein